MADNKINVGGRLHSIATGNVLAGADEIFDDEKNKKQNDINTETYSLVNNINERLDSLSPDQQSALNVATKATNNETKLGYYVCDTEGNLAAKVISDATGYILSKGGSIKVKMTSANIADNATLNINSTGAKPLYYDGERASASNTWEADETVEIYYDGTNFYANNVSGGSGSGDGAFDVSVKYPTSGVDGGNTYTLEGALAVLNTNLSANKKKGGMSIKFIHSSDNKYVQFRYTGTETTGNPNPFLDTDNWTSGDGEFSTGEKVSEIGIDDELTPGSNNLAKSGRVYDALFNRVESNNKLDWSARLLNKYIDNHGVIVDNSNGFCVSNAITVKKGDIIYHSLYSSELSLRLPLIVEACEFDSNNTFIKKTTVTWESSDGEFLSCEITGDNTAYIRINFKPGATDTDGVVFINEKLPYEPYIGPTYEPKYVSKDEAEERFGHAVLYIPQTLTDAQKTQARTNIKSASDAEVEFLFQRVNDLAGEIQNGRINILMVDTLQNIKEATSTLNTIGPFDIVSSTENTITLSSEDFANIYDYEVQGLCVEIPVAGRNYPDYKIAIFKKSDNNTLEQYSTTIDLTNATRCSSIHDTLYAGNGIHLSPFGYRALACTIVERLTMKDCYNNKNYIGGFVSMNCKTGRYNTENIEAPDGTILIRPIRVNAKNGGVMPGTNITPLWGYIDNRTTNSSGFSNLMKQFVFMQYKEETDDEVSIELPFTFGRTNGYLVIEGNCDGKYPGRAKIEVIENGVTVWETIMSDIAQKYIIGLRTWSNFSVKVSLPENNKVTMVQISAVCLYEMYGGFEYPNLSGKTIAVLGDSWCVYNDMTTSKHFLGENNEDCENFGQYPDGTPTEYSAYCALFPKYLAHITGSTVDNWGRGGTTSANWGLVKIDHILDFKSYDYLVIEFFTNDKIGEMNVDTWRRNLQEICRKCIKRGVQPIVIMPCVNQGTGFGFAEWNNYLLQGLYFGLD